MRKYLWLIVISLALLFPVNRRWLTAVSIPTQFPQQQSASGPSNPQELEAFMDDFLAREMAEKHIPGATFALVKTPVQMKVDTFGTSDFARLKGEKQARF